MIESCTIITQSSYPELTQIHDRMPITLPESKYKQWLSCELEGFPTIEMKELAFYPISNDVARLEMAISSRDSLKVKT